MSQSLKKMKRVQPVIKVRSAQVDNEAAILNEIRTRKQAVVAEMKSNQRQYMEGIDRLNQERASMNREMLVPLEDSLDFIKSKWFMLYREVQELEHREQVQLTKVLAAQRDLKAVERLQENYKKQFATDLKKTEQKNLDEVGIRRYNNQNQG